MARTVVYPEQLQRMRRRGAYTGADSEGADGDNYRERLAKYVPGEVLAAFIPASTEFNSQTQAGILLAVGALVTPIYLLQAARKLPAEKKPLPHFYLLAIPAFLAWAVGTTPEARHFLGISAKTGAFALLIASLMIPALDFIVASGYTHFRGNRGAGTSRTYGTN